MKYPTTAKAVAFAVPVIVAMLLAGCGETQFEKDCKADGGVVETEREKCGTKTTGSGSSRKKVDKKQTEYECVVDGREVDESEGPCL